MACTAFDGHFLVLRTRLYNARLNLETRATEEIAASSKMSGLGSGVGIGPVPETVTELPVSELEISEPSESPRLRC